MKIKETACLVIKSSIVGIKDYLYVAVGDYYYLNLDMNSNILVYVKSIVNNKVDLISFYLFNDVYKPCDYITVTNKLKLAEYLGSRKLSTIETIVLNVETKDV